VRVSSCRVPAPAGCHDLRSSPRRSRHPGLSTAARQLPSGAATMPASHGGSARAVSAHGVCRGTATNRAAVGDIDQSSLPAIGNDRRSARCGGAGSAEGDLGSPSQPGKVDVGPAPFADPVRAVRHPLQCAGGVGDALACPRNQHVEAPLS
jgi:hypothetical protein